MVAGAVRPYTDAIWERNVPSGPREGFSV
jgi:hypothetical protein